jgi:hypothetical protein
MAAKKSAKATDLMPVDAVRHKNNYACGNSLKFMREMEC